MRNFKIKIRSKLGEYSRNKEWKKIFALVDEVSKDLTQIYGYIIIDVETTEGKSGIVLYSPDGKEIYQEKKDGNIE